MRYDTVLLDADNTLLDFSAAEHTAFLMLMREYGLPETEELCRRYSAYNRSLWKQLERGTLSREELIRCRFRGFFRQLGAEDDGHAEEKYREYLTVDNRLMPGALEVCRELADRCRLYIVTNGMAGTQRKRIRGSGLEPFLSGLFISQEIGFAKPDPAFFRAVFQALPEAEPRRTLLVGDSLTSDIAGGAGYGIDTCWYCPGEAPTVLPMTPAYRIRSLTELPPLVFGEEN